MQASVHTIVHFSDMDGNTLSQGCQSPDHDVREYQNRSLYYVVGEIVHKVFKLQKQVFLDNVFLGSLPF